MSEAPRMLQGDLKWLVAGVQVHLNGVGVRTVYPVLGTLLADLMEAIYLASVVGPGSMCLRCLTTIQSMKDATSVEELLQVGHV